MASITEIKSLLDTYRQKNEKIKDAILTLHNLFDDDKDICSKFCIQCTGYHYTDKQYDHIKVNPIYTGFLNDEIEIVCWGDLVLTFNNRGLVVRSSGMYGYIRDLSWDKKKYILQNLDTIFEKIQNFLKESIEKMDDCQPTIDKIQNIVKGLGKEGK